jgi:hypothetical protein
MSLSTVLHSDPCTCSRIPIRLEIASNTNGLEGYFHIKAHLFDPDVYVGVIDNEPKIMKMSQIIGFQEPIHGLSVTSHSKQGLIEGFRWLGSESGRCAVSAFDFLSYTGATLNRKETHQVKTESWVGRNVLVGGIEMLCLKHLNSGAVGLQNLDGGPCVWRKASDITIICQK